MISCPSRTTSRIGVDFEMRLGTGAPPRDGPPLRPSRPPLLRPSPRGAPRSPVGRPWVSGPRSSRPRPRPRPRRRPRPGPPCGPRGATGARGTGSPGSVIVKPGRSSPRRSSGRLSTRTASAWCEPVAAPGSDGRSTTSERSTPHSLSTSSSSSSSSPALSTRGDDASSREYSTSGARLAGIEPLARSSGISAGPGGSETGEPPSVASSSSSPPSRSCASASASASACTSPRLGRSGGAAPSCASAAAAGGAAPPPGSTRTSSSAGPSSFMACFRPPAR